MDITYKDEDFFKWIPNGDGYDLVYQPPFDVSCLVFAYDIRTDKGFRYAIDLDVKGYPRIKIRPEIGVVTMHKRHFAMPNEIIAHFVPGEDALRREREKERSLYLELEKKRIAQKLIEKQRRRELEKAVEQELIEKGVLFGEQHKRPPIPREVVDAVYRRDGGRCVYCGSTENLQLDHIIPFSKGGATTLENLQLLCQKCNLEKSNKIG